MTKDEARILFGDLLEELLHAGEHLRIAAAYRNLAGEFKTAIAKTRDFWFFTNRAHIDAAIFILCRVYVASGLSLENLLKEIQDKRVIPNTDKFNQPTNLLIDLSQLSADIKKVSDHNRLVKILRGLRNCHFAHKTPRGVYDPGKLGKDFPLTIKDLETLQEEGLRTLNYYGGIVFNDTGHQTSTQVAEIRLILESVRSSPLTMRQVLEQQTVRESN